MRKLAIAKQNGGSGLAGSCLQPFGRRFARGDGRGACASTGVCSGGGRAWAKVGSRKKPQRRVPRPAGLDLVRRRQAQQDRLSSSRDGRSARISSSRGSSGSRSVGSESGERGASCGSTEMLLQQCAVWGKTKRNVFWHKRARTHRDEGSGALKAGGRPSRSCSQAGRARPHSREPGGGRQQHAQHV